MPESPGNKVEYSYMDSSVNQRRVSPWLWVFTLGLAAVLLYYALQKVNWNIVFTTLSRGNLSLLALAVGLLTFSCVLRGLRWRVLLSTEKTLPPLTVFWANMAGYLGNSFLPARAGELMRSVLIGQKGGISKTFSLATALTERIVDAIILVVAGAAALTTLSVLPEQLVKTLRWMAVVGAIGAVFVIIAPHMGSFIQKIITRLPVSEKLREKAGIMASSFLVGAGALQHWGRLVQFLFYSAGIWTMDTLTALTTAQALHLNLNAAQVFILLAALGIFSAVPQAPGGIGVYQAVATTVLVPFGLNDSQAIAYIFGYQGVNYVVILIWGLLGLWRLKGSLHL